MLYYLCQLDGKEVTVLTTASVKPGAPSKMRGEKCGGSNTAGSQGGGEYTRCKDGAGGEEEGREVFQQSSTWAGMARYGP